MKLCGSIIILAASFLFARTRLRERKQEIETLSSLCTALEHMHAKLAASLMPLPELTAQLSRDSRGEVANFFAQVNGDILDVEFRQNWRSAVENRLRRLQPEDRRTVMDLGDWLGRYTLQEQLTALERSCAALCDSRDHQRKKYTEERKLSYGLSAAVGIFLAIMLA